MASYRVIFSGSKLQADSIIKQIQKFDDTATLQLWNHTWEKSRKRNKEIIELYKADPTKNSSGRLAIKYGLTRERVCQVLRRENLIEDVKARRALVKAATKTTIHEIQEEAQKIWDAKLHEAIELVKKGESYGRAAKKVGMGYTAAFSNAVGKQAKLLEIPIQNSRWKDFTQRRKLVQACSDKGMNLTHTVTKLKKVDKTINYQWIIRNMPECFPDFRHKD